MSNHSFLWPQKERRPTLPANQLARRRRRPPDRRRLPPTSTLRWGRRPAAGGAMSDRGAAGDRRHGSLAEDLLRQAGDLVRRRGQHLSALDRPRELSSRLAIPMLMPLSCSGAADGSMPRLRSGLCQQVGNDDQRSATIHTASLPISVTTRLRAQWPGQSRGLSPDRPSPWPSCLPRGSSSRPA